MTARVAELHPRQRTMDAVCVLAGVGSPRCTCPSPVVRGPPKEHEGLLTRSGRPHDGAGPRTNLLRAGARAFQAQQWPTEKDQQMHPQVRSDQQVVPGAAAQDGVHRVAEFAPEPSRVQHHRVEARAPVRRLTLSLFRDELRQRCVHGVGHVDVALRTHGHHVRFAELAERSPGLAEHRNHLAVLVELQELPREPVDHEDRLPPDLEVARQPQTGWGRLRVSRSRPRAEPPEVALPMSQPALRSPSVA